MHLEALTSEGRSLFPELVVLKGFYLAGGTALALQVGHRVSQDFDCFTSQPLSDAWLTTLESIDSSERVSILVNTAHELTVILSEVKISLIHYPFPLINKLVTLNPFPLPLLSVEEIAATKAYTIGRRGSYRDYVDMYTVLARNLASLGDIVALAEQKYGEHFNGRLFLEQLLYLDDVRDDTITYLIDRVTREDIMHYFKQAVASFRLDS